MVIVTGGTGYIGSHTAVELINAGFDVLIIDNLSNSRIEVLDGIEKITGVRPAFIPFDLCDKKELEKALAPYKDIDSIIHFAAYKAVGESVEKPLKYYHNNLVSLMNILDIMQEQQILNLVFSSSCTVYGQPDVLPVTEESPIKPAFSPYGNTKQMAEEIIYDTILANKGLQCISLRYFNPIGAHPTALIGELPTGIPDNLVPYITQTAIGLRKELQVFGDDYNTPDGSAIRDYLHVVDLAKAHVVAIKRLMESKNDDPFEIFNLGTGKGVSVFEILNTFEKVTGQKIPYRITNRRPGDVEAVYADTKKANRILGWKTESSLGETLLTAWNWEKYFRGKKS